jgi:hypothetical protein
MSVAAFLAESSGGGALPTIGLLIAFILFLAIVGWVFVVPSEAWRRDAEIPLENDERSPANGAAHLTEKHHG